MAAYPFRMGFDIATSAFTCDFCHEPLRPEALGIAKRLTGWVENRKGGGAHAIRFPETPSGYAHTVCLEAAKHPSAGSSTQSLF